MKRIPALMLLALLPTLTVAQTVNCGNKDATELDKMSQKKLMEVYCSADAAVASATSSLAIDDERTADVQRQCLDQKKKVAEVLKQRFISEAPTCNPLIESPKK